MRHLEIRNMGRTRNGSLTVYVGFNVAVAYESSYFFGLEYSMSDNNITHSQTDTHLKLRSENLEDH